MRLYGVIQAFRAGRMPDNTQIDNTLKYFIEHSPVDLDKLSPEGRKLVEDVRAILTTTRQQCAEKNADEVLQQFIYHTSSQQFRDRAIKNTKTALPDDGTLPNKEDAKKDSEQAVQHLRTLAQLLLTNNEARKLIQDFTLIGRDMFAHGAAKAAERARPDLERMERVDDPAPNTYAVGFRFCSILHSHSSRPQGDGAIPKLEGGIDITQTGFRGALKEGLAKAEAKVADKAEVTPPSQVVASNVDQDVNLHRDGFRGTASNLKEAAVGAASVGADQAGEFFRFGHFHEGHRADS